MKASVLDVSLTQGQLIWVLSHGEFPSEPKARQLAAELRYLRALGVPFEEAKRGRGRGNRLSYSFDEFSELSIAVAALRRGLRPKDVAAYLTKHRRDVRALCRQIVKDLPPISADEPRHQRGGRTIVLRGEEQFLRLHDRHFSGPGKFEVLPAGEVNDFEDFMGMREVFPDGAVRPLIPITRLLIEIARLVLKAPVVRPGPG